VNGGDHRRKLTLRLVLKTQADHPFAETRRDIGTHYRQHVELEFTFPCSRRDITAFDIRVRFAILIAMKIDVSVVIASLSGITAL
jgi:hypothetical protein